MPLARWVPGLDSLLHYRRAWFRPDVQAGLSVAAIQIPTAIAYAQIAGFPPQVGLYACILPMLIYALIGSSRQLMVGPDAATAAMVAAAITPLAAGDPQRLVDLSMIVAIMVGLFSIVAGLARAGFIASFLSRPILVGYLNGIGLSLLVTQLVGVVAALVIAATLLLLNKPLGWVPMPALGAVLLLAGWGLIDVQALKGFWKLSRFEFSLCLLTTVGVLSVGVLPGIFVAVSIAVLRLLYYTYRPSDAVLGWMHGIDGQVELAKYPQATTLPGLVIYRFDAPLLFFNADYFKQRVLAVVDGSERPNAVLLNAEAMTNLDISGLATLHEVQQILKAQGVHLSLARVTGQTLDLLQRSSMLGEIKPPLVFSSVRSGVSAYRYWLRQQERLAAQAAATSGNA